jgi:hypothetical protein
MERMNKPKSFPIKVRFTKKFLEDNPKVKQRIGTATRITKGYANVATVTYEGRKGNRYIHLKFLEEVTEQTTNQ